jgi:hypothetical protein
MSVEFIEPKDLEQWTHKTIDFMRKGLKLEPHECYVTLKILIEEFPKEYIPKNIHELVKK